MKDAIKELEYAIVRERSKLLQLQKVIRNQIKIKSALQFEERNKQVLTYMNKIREFEQAIKYLHSVCVPIEIREINKEKV